MLSATDVLNQVNKLIHHLVKIGLATDQNLAFLKSDSANTVEITFQKSGLISAALKDEPYTEIYKYFADERAFMVKMIDGALIQMRYLFTNDKIQRHTLSFLPAPHLEEFQSNPEIYLLEEIYADIVARSIVPFPFRFDCDCRDEVAKPVEHPKSHFTLGQYINCRIPVSSPVTPACFITFVLRNFYHTGYLKFADDLPILKEVFSETIFVEERTLPFLQVPCSNA